MSQSTMPTVDSTPPSSQVASSQEPATRDSGASQGAQAKHHLTLPSDSAPNHHQQHPEPMLDGKGHDGDVDMPGSMSPDSDGSPRAPVARFATQEAAGAKRTASGSVKSPSSASPTRRARATLPGHSRTISLESAGSGVGELSATLRARLSYAMVKVQHGWQSRSLDEVESIAAKQAPPMRSPRQRANPSVAAALSLSRENSGKSSDSQDVRVTSASPEIVTAAAAGIPNGVENAARTYDGESDRSAEASAASRTYAAFWRDHGTTSVAKVLEAQRAMAPSTSTPADGRPAALAPPVDITSRHPRRPQSSDEHYPPMLSTNFPTNNTHGRPISSSNASGVPSTPPPDSSNGVNREPLIRTPSQKRAMEQDAVETLLFMSSPGNSQNMRDQTVQQQQQQNLCSPRHPMLDPAGNAQTTRRQGPLMSDASPFGSPKRARDRFRLQPEEATMNGHAHHARPTLHAEAQRSSDRNTVHHATRLNDDEMDARLDEVSDESSDEEL